MMKSDDREKRWMAYLDGQMSASEALDFERGLNARDRARLEGEVRLESAICDSLADGPCCPVALWNDMKSRLNEPGQVKAGRMAYWVSRATIILAATVAIVLSAPYYESYTQGNSVRAASRVGILESSREEFSKGLEATRSMAAAEAYLRENNINLRLIADSAPGPGHHHQLEFLGACRGKCPEGTLYELRFWCCGQPAKVLIARRGSAGDRVLRSALKCGEVDDIPVDNDYVIAVIGDHNAEGLHRLVQPLRGNLT